MAIEVFSGNTADPTTFTARVNKIRRRIGIPRVVLVGDRGRTTSKRMDEDLREVEGLEWITALRNDSIRKLVEQKTIPLSLFDERDLAEVTSSDYPDERWMVCRNPLLAEERARKRNVLPRAAEKKLDAVVQAISRKRCPLRGKDQIGLRVGRDLKNTKMQQHFELEINDDGRWAGLKCFPRLNRDRRMSLSRGWGDNPEQVLAGDDPDMLRKSLQDPPRSVQHLRTAETLLREHLRRGNSDEDSARLLLCAALTLRGVYDPDRRISQAHDIEELLNSIRPARCALTDLLIAIEIFIHGGKLAQADWLIGGALQVSEGTAEHRRVLRMASALRYDLGREKEVLEHCMLLAEMDPSDPEPWRQMAMVYEDGGYQERLIETLQRLVQLDKNGAAEDRLKLINTLISVGQRSQARAEYDILAEQSPDLTARHPLTLAKLLMLENDTASATATVAQILDEDPQATDALLFSGQLLLSRNRLPEAMETIERLLELDPMKFQAHYVLGQISARLGQRERARQLIHLYESLGMTRQAEFRRRASRISGRGQ